MDNVSSIGIIRRKFGKCRRVGKVLTAPDYQRVCMDSFSIGRLPRVFASVVGICWFFTADLSAAEESSGKYDGYYWGENEDIHICGELGEKRFVGTRLGAFIKGENFLAVLASEGPFSGKVSADGVISARKFLRFHRRFQQEIYTHYDGKIVGDEIHIRIRQALADKSTALCSYVVLVMKKTDPPKEPTEKEKAQRKLLRFNEHFSNALVRYRVANNCMRRK